MNLKTMFTLGVLSLAAALPAQAFNENKDLLFYADFNSNNVKPVVANDGAALQKGENLEFVPGKFGEAVYFSMDKKSDLVYKLGGELSANNDWTIAFYIKPDQPGNAFTDGKGKVRHLFRTYNSGAWGDGDIFMDINTWAQMSAGRFGADKKMASATISAGVIPAGDWTHVAVTGKDGVAKIYINGVEAKLTRDTKLEGSGSIQKFVRLGCSYTGGDTWLTGALDEFKVFKRALDANEIKIIMETKPDGKTDTALDLPVLQLPFNGRIDAVSTRGGLSGNSERMIFKNAVIGKGAEFSRHGYDARSVMTLELADGMLNAPELSGGFFFILKADAKDDNLRGLLSCAAGGNLWNITRRGKVLTLTVSDGKNTDQISAPLPADADKKFVHIAFGYGKGKIFLAFDGKEAAVKPMTFVMPAPAAPSKMRLGDLADAGTYDTTQAEGIMDELRIFSRILADAEIAAEIARKDNPELAKGTDSDAPPVKFVAVNDKEKVLWGPSGESRQDNGSRQTIYLNGLWRFLPVANDGAKLPWHYLAVPGRYAGHENGRSDVEFRIRKPDLSILNDYTYDGKPTWQYNSALFERTFALEPIAADRRIVLTFDELSSSGSGKVWLNDRYLGNINPSEGADFAIDPKMLNFDGGNRLLLQVDDDGQRWSWRGVKGDVYLQILPLLELSKPQIITGVADRTLKVAVDLKNHCDQAQSVRARIAITGKNAPGLLESKPQTVGPGATARFDIKQIWSNPELWDFENPYLYRAQITLVNSDGKVLDRLDEIPFGYREFTINGKNYELNGKVVHLRNHDEWADSTWDYPTCLAVVKNMKALGYNAFRGPFSDKDYDLDNMIKACDEEGLLYFFDIGGVKQKEYTNWNSDETKSAMYRKMEVKVDRYRNHPSIVLWYLSVNFLGYAWDYHPLKMADGYLPCFNLDKAAAAESAAKYLNQLDPTRPWFFQAGGNFGPIITSNAYFCWLPEAEKFAWAEPWREIGTKPLHVIETSFPYVNSFYGMDLNNPGAKPLFLTENAARFFGDQAYLGTSAKESEMTKLYRNPKADSWAFHGEYRKYPTVEAVKNHLLGETVKSWRGSGISGICPFAEFGYAYDRKSPSPNIHNWWSAPVTGQNMRSPGWHPDVWKYAAHLDVDFDKPLALAATLKESLSPILIYIAGDQDHFASKANNYYPGRTVERTVVAVNDTLETRNFDLDFTLDGKKTGNFNQILQPGQIARIPVKLTLPDATRCEFAVITNQPADVARTAKTFELIAPVSGKVADAALYGPAGEFGLTFADAAKLSNLNDLKILVVGQKQYDKSFVSWAQQVKLADWIEAGGNVIVLEQTPQALTSLGLKTHNVYLRQVFPTALLPGVTSTQLGYWHGYGNLAEHHAAPPANSEEKIPEQLWHYTAEDMVSADPIRRPFAGAAQALAVGGKDLLYAPMLRFAAGKGSVTFCQLEISNRPAEPMAGKILKALVDSARNTVNPAPKALYTFGKTDTYGFAGQPFAAPIRQNAIILGDGDWEQILPAVAAGSDCLVALPSPGLAAKLKLKLQPCEFDTLTLTATGKELLPGLGARDLYFRYGAKGTSVTGDNVAALTANNTIVAVPYGKGKIWINTLSANDPDQLKQAQSNLSSSRYFAEEIYLERFNQINAMLLAKLGAVPAFNMARQLADPAVAPAEISLDGEWAFCFDPERKVDPAAALAAKAGEGLWTTVKVPGFWENQNIDGKYLPGNLKAAKDYNGFAWYVKTVKIPDDMQKRDLVLEMKTVDDLDTTYVNGQAVGKTGEETPGYWEFCRRYPIFAKLNQSNMMTVAVEVNDLRGNGGIAGNVRLVEKTAPGHDTQASPYGDLPVSTYNTEKAIRW